MSIFNNLDDDAKHDIAIRSGMSGLHLCDQLRTVEKRRHCRTAIRERYEEEACRRRLKAEIQTDVKKILHHPHDSPRSSTIVFNEEEEGAGELEAQRYWSHYVYYYSDIKDGRIQMLGIAISHHFGKLSLISANVRVDGITKYIPEEVTNIREPSRICRQILWKLKLSDDDDPSGPVGSLPFFKSDMTEVHTEVAESVDEALVFMRNHATFKITMMDNQGVSFYDLLARWLAFRTDSAGGA